MIPISFSCNCGQRFVSKSGIYKTAQKQLHHNGWIDVFESNGHVKRVCPNCQQEARGCVTIKT